MKVAQVSEAARDRLVLAAVLVAGVVNVLWIGVLLWSGFRVAEAIAVYAVG